MKKYSIYIILSLLLVYAPNAQTSAQAKTEADTGTYVIRRMDRGSGTPGQMKLNVEIRQLSPKDAMQEIQNRRVEFFTEAIDLTPEEAEVFWPIYNQYMAKRNKLSEGRKAIVRNCIDQRVASMTDAAAEEMADKYINLQQQEYNLQAEYYKKFKAILPAKKILLMYQAEDEFMQNLLRYLRKNSPSRSTVRTEVKTDTKVND